MTYKAWVWDGAVMSPLQGVPPCDRGFRLGMSVFETIRIAEERPRFVDRHLVSLRDACTTAGIPVDSSGITAAAECLAGSGIAHGTGRIHVTAGDGNPRDPVTSPRIIAWVEAVPNPPRMPQTAVLIRADGPVFLGGLKTGCYWQNLQWLAEAVAAGAEEAIVVNRDSTLRGASMANLFLRTDAGWTTPRTADGARAGIVRAWLMSLLGAKESRLTTSDLQCCAGAVLTSSLIGPCQLRMVDGRPLECHAEIDAAQTAFCSAG